MTLYNKIIQKAAVQTAAFFILLLPFLAPAVGHAKTKTITSELLVVEKKAINLLIQKQKKQALATVSDYILYETNKNSLNEAREFRQALAKKFSTKESQEFYETSLNLTLDNPKEAKKNNEDCLALDPENLDCLIQRLRLFYRENRKKPIEASEIEKTAKYFEGSDFNWVKASTGQLTIGTGLADLKATSFSKVELGTEPDEKLVSAVLDLNRAFVIKNLSKAKEILNRIEKKFSDWPDLIYYKNKMNTESAEQNALVSTELSNQYINKCKNLSKSTVRKYRYDFDLCLRGGV